MGVFHIKNYDEYIRIIKQTFSNIEKMPSNPEIKSFISKYNLNVDWKIRVNEVWEDINSYIFCGQYKKLDRKKRVLSYKGYLDILKIEFGIPQNIPTKEEIEIFISKYNLEEDWGITEKEILKDFESIIDGKYDDMYKDAIQDTRKTVRKNVEKSYVSKRATSNTVHTYSVCVSKEETAIIQRKPLCSCTFDKNIGTEKKDRIKKGSNTTILVDGDNHIHEAEKGIEHTSKTNLVKVFFSQPGAQKKFNKKYSGRSNVSSKLVKPGKQAADNQIKAEAGQILQRDKEQRIAIVSRDKGFEDFANRKSNNRISTAKSVQEVMNKMN